MMKPAQNSSAWAIGKPNRGGFHVRCIKWGLLAAQFERRADEQIRAASISVERAFKKSRRQTPPPM